MAFSLALQEKIYHQLFLQETGSLTPETIFVTLHGALPDRGIALDEPLIAQSMDVAWNFVPSTHSPWMVENGTEIVLTALNTAVVEAAVTWGVTSPGGSPNAEVYPLDIIPLFPFGVSQGQKITYAAGSFRIAIDPNFQHPRFSDLLLNLLYVRQNLPTLPNSYQVSGHPVYGASELTNYLEEIFDQPEIFTKQTATWESDSANGLTNAQEITATASGSADPHLLQYWWNSNSPIIYTTVESELSGQVSYPEQTLKLYYSREAIPPAGTTDFRLLVLDTPLLQSEDEDLGVYVAVASSETWTSNVELEISRDAITWEPGITLTPATTLAGEVSDFSSFNASHLTIDGHNHLTVDLGAGASLTSPSELDWYNETLLVLWGAEIISVGQVQELSPGVFRLSKFLRGLRGTEDKIASHDLNEPLVVLQNLTRLPLLQADIGSTLYVRGVFEGQLTLTKFIFTNQAGITYAPAPPQLQRNLATGEVTFITAPRQIHDRWGSNFELDVYSNTGQLLRTLSSNSSEIPYTAAQQLFDFGTSVTEVSFILYQTNFYGRGKPTAIDDAKISIFI